MRGSGFGYLFVALFSAFLSFSISDRIILESFVSGFSLCLYDIAMLKAIKGFVIKLHNVI